VEGVLVGGDVGDGAFAVGGEFPGGVLPLSFVNLALISDPKLVLPAIAQALGVRETAGEMLSGLVREHLRGRGTMLLILDNFEQSVAAAAEVFGAAG